MQMLGITSNERTSPTLINLRPYILNWDILIGSKESIWGLLSASKGDR